MSPAIKWGLSVLDWRSHAIDERAYHSVGVFKAECGHLLMSVIELHDRPNGKPCAACGGKQLEAARAALDRAAPGARAAGTALAAARRIDPDRPPVESGSCPVPLPPPSSRRPVGPTAPTS